MRNLIRRLKARKGVLAMRKQFLNYSEHLRAVNTRLDVVVE